MPAVNHTPTRLLVTGGAGFIGCNFVQHWIKKHPDHRVVVLDALTYAGNLANLEPVHGHAGFRFVQGDIRDQALVESLLREEKIDTLVHFAAESHVDRSILGPEAFIDTNVIGTHRLLMAAKKIWIDTPVNHRFHHVSTDEVYGSLGMDDAAFTESTPYSPNSPYAASKAASDHLVRAYHHTYGLHTTISNCSNNYGPYHFPEKLIPLVIVNILLGKPLPVYGDGSNIRDWLYVRDHARGIEQVLTAGLPGQTYNIGGNCERRNIDIVRLLCKLVDQAITANPAYRERFSSTPIAAGRTSESLITFVKDRLGHDWRYAIDAGKARRELGYAPVYDFETGLRQTVAWYLENESWWRQVLDGSYRAWIRQQYEQVN
jgi:dTDP-glucose 4,6-dehydratase